MERSGCGIVLVLSSAMATEKKSRKKKSVNIKQWPVDSVMRHLAVSC